MTRRDSKGFTIIELLIATVVFSLVMLVVMGAIIQFGRVYYKGVVQSRTQERARAISEDIAKHLQFGKSFTPSTPLASPPSARYISAGGRTYTYDIGKQVPFEGHGLVATSTSGGYNQMSTQALASGATEMLGERMQLARLVVTSSGDRYDITVRVVYGEDGDFVGNNPLNPCEPIVFGGQFCAVSELTTTVTKRLK